MSLQVTTVAVAIFLAGSSVVLLMVDSPQSNGPRDYDFGAYAIGDEVHYSYIEKDGAQTNEGKLTLRWIEPEPVLFLNGTELLANSLEIIVDSDVNSTSKQFFTGSGKAIGFALDYQTNGARQTELLGIPILRQDQTSTGSLRGTMPEQPFCFTPFLNSATAGTSFVSGCLLGEPTAMETADGLHYEDTQPFANLTIDFDPGLPYPVEIRVEDHFIRVGDRTARNIVFHLTNFEAGDSNLGPASKWNQVVTVEEKAVTPWVFAQSGNSDLQLQDLHKYLVESEQDILVDDAMVFVQTSASADALMSSRSWIVIYDTGVSVTVTLDSFIAAETPPTYRTISKTIDESDFAEVATIITMESIEALWLHQVGSPTIFDSGQLAATCRAKENGKCTFESFDIRLDTDRSNSTPLESDYQFGGIQLGGTDLYFFRLSSESSNSPALAPAYERSAQSSDPTGAINIFSATNLAGAGVIVSMLYFLKPALVGLFSREVNDPLEHPARASIMATVQASPGVHFQEIRRQTKLAAGTTQHHIRMLENSKQLVQEKALGKSCYFPKDRRGRQERLQQIARQDEKLSTILDAVRSGPQTMSILAEKLQVSASTANHHVAKLQDLQLVRLEKIGRTTWVNAS